MVEHRCLGNRRIYFQHGRIHPHRAFERHRTKLRHGGDRNGCDDYGLCVDCRADFAAAAADAADAQLWNGAACCWSCLRCITVSHILSFASWRFEILLASRVGIVLTHAVFWSITASLAVRIAPVGKGNQALGLLSTGTVMAMAAGIPLGRMVGQYLGWQASFLLIGLCSAAVMAVLAKSLPRLPSVNTGSLSSLPLLLKRKKLMLLYAVTVPVITAHFTAYSYIEPFVIQIGGFSARQVTVVPGLYGLAGFAASYLFGKWFAKHPRAFSCRHLRVGVRMGDGDCGRQLGDGCQSFGFRLRCRRPCQLDLFGALQRRYRRRRTAGTLGYAILGHFLHRRCGYADGGGRFAGLPEFEPPYPNLTERCRLKPLPPFRRHFD